MKIGGGVGHSQTGLSCCALQRTAKWAFHCIDFLAFFPFHGQPFKAPLFLYSEDVVDCDGVVSLLQVCLQHL